MKQFSITWRLMPFVWVLWTTGIILAQDNSLDQDNSAATRLAGVMSGRAPVDVAELRALQGRIKDLTDRMLSSTVAIQVGRANGSGVIVSPNGYVLTAAHVAGTPGQPATVVLSNRRVARGKTLGLNQELDAGLIKITDEGEWPYAPLGNSGHLKAGQWCLATGHPGGFDRERLPVLRWGRILKAEPSAVLTDCTLVGGDSGGPLFDLDGNVVGIHSRIGKNLTINVHVPVDPFRESWARFARGEVWGVLEPAQQGWLGVTEDKDAKSATVSDVLPNSPAEAADLKAGDIILRVNDARIETFGDLQAEIRQHRPDDTVELHVRRGQTILQIPLRLAKRPHPRRG